jgi:serine/threonine-protein kinase HipA
MTARCPITYEPLQKGEEKYSQKGLSLLSKKLYHLNDFPYTQQAQKEEAISLAGKLSIQGVQPKLSLLLDAKHETFLIAPQGGLYILKMQSDWPNLPENEDLTMRLAKIVGLEVPLHGLLYCQDQTFSYWIRRFDRPSARQKLPLEDFAQLLSHTRETKYEASMEQVIEVIDHHTSFPVLEKEKLFLLTLFNFLVGNEDMHLKNFSLLRVGDKISLSPCYDLLNTTLALGKAVKEELALPLQGKKNKLTAEDLVSYFGRVRLGLSERRLDYHLDLLKRAQEVWFSLISSSFLEKHQKVAYAELVKARAQRLFKA